MTHTFICFPDMLNIEENMRTQELIVGLNSLQWDIETFKKMKDKDINYYAEILGEVQEILINQDR